MYLVVEGGVFSVRGGGWCIQWWRVVYLEVDGGVFSVRGGGWCI